MSVFTESKIPRLPTGAVEQEWTGEFVKGLLYAESIESGIGDIVAAHNAALAAERDENWRNAYDNLLIDYTRLREQLAAERETARRAGVVALQFKEQLAATVEALEDAYEGIKNNSRQEQRAIRIATALAKVKEGR